MMNVLRTRGPLRTCALWIRYGIVRRITFFLHCISNYVFSPYTKRLKKMKNVHYGERCFIVATGPSLSYDDLDLIKNEYSFSMNSMIMAFDKTEWRPTYYGIQDENVYEKVKGYIANSDLKPENIFIGSPIYEKYKTNSLCNRFLIDFLNQYVMREVYGRYYTKFSSDFSLKAYNGYTITYSLIQLAYYMGFREIYLLGCDCNYKIGEKQHFIEHGHYDPSAEKAQDRLFCSYKVAKKFADENGLKIFNATRGGMLEIFDRVDLTALMNSKNMECCK